MLAISIAILTYNRGPLLKELLSGLSSLHYKPLEVIVVDNCSEDETPQIVSREFPNVIYERLSKNIGAAARNVGLKRAAGDIVITLDDDILGIHDEALLRISHHFAHSPQLGALNFKVIDYFTGEICNWVHHRDVEAYGEKEFCTYEITEGAVAFRRDGLAKAGYYPEHFFLSHEGPDLAFRLIDSGYDVVYTHEIAVQHKHSNLGRRNWLNYYYDTRNQLWVAARNLPLFYGLLYLSRGLASMLFYSIRDGYLLYWLRAVRDGVKGLDEALRARKVIREDTIKYIKQIDRFRPSVGYLMRERILKRGIRL